jgi:hypothetical protein
MSRYTDYLKEKVICVHCQIVISRGYIENHKQTTKHLENIKKPIKPLTGNNYSLLSYSKDDGTNPSQ